MSLTNNFPLFIQSSKHKVFPLKVKEVFDQIGWSRNDLVLINLSLIACLFIALWEAL